MELACTTFSCTLSLLLAVKPTKLTLPYPTHPSIAKFRQVEALTLRREDGTFEAACNLLRPKETTPAMVLAAAEKRATAVGIRVLEHYETGLTEEEAMAAISRLTLERR